jgi:hypothetical protein
MLNQRNDGAGHKPRRAHRFARARHLDDLDDAPSCRDLDSATGAGGDDLVRPSTLIGSHDDFDAIAPS